MKGHGYKGHVLLFFHGCLKKMEMNKIFTFLIEGIKIIILISLILHRNIFLIHTIISIRKNVQCVIETSSFIFCSIISKPF